YEVAMKRVSKDLHIYEVMNVNEDLIQIWQKFRQLWDTTLNRDPDMMKWLFFDFYKNSRRRVAIAKDKKRPLGYLVYQEDIINHRIYVIEIISKDLNLISTTYLIHYILGCARKMKASWVELAPFYKNCALAAILMGGLLFKGYPNYFYLTSSKLEKNIDENKWYATLLDPDRGALN
ncbi:MAG: hypothetical protein JSW07_09080, partial [bacterium]